MHECNTAFHMREIRWSQRVYSTRALSEEHALYCFIIFLFHSEQKDFNEVNS
jgi:hypothetical protein